MAIGNYYPVSGTVVDQDLFLGTKAGNNNTVNYTAQTVANYLNTNSKVAIGGQISFRFDISPNIPKTISFSGGGGSGTPFSSITQLIVSGIDLSSTDITIFLNYLNGSEILLAQQNQPNLFGNYKITSYTQIGTSNFYTLGLQFIGGNGTITENTYYNLSSFVLSSGIDVPTLNQVLTAGNTSIIDAKVGNLYSYDNVNADYGIVQFYDSGVALKGASTNNLLFYNDDTGTVKFSNGTYAPTLNFAGVGNNVYTFQNANGTLAFLSDIPSLSGYVPTSRTLTINGTTYDLTANRSWSVGTVTSIGMTVPSAFNVTPSTITSSGTFAITGAGVASQYVRGDGTLANFPTSTGGGASVSYYLNGSISQGTIGGVAYKEMNSVPVIGTGTDFTINADGYIAQFITDVGDPNKLLIPGGNWNFETYFSASSGGGSPSFYIELYKYNGTTFTLIASNSTSPEFITGGTSIDLYFSALAVPPTTLTVTDRLAVRFYVIHSGRTITMHTENSHLSQVITTFSSGLTALNGLTSQVQYFAVGTSGTDFNISSATDTHTFNLPTASAANRGALSSADWTAFNSKFNLPSLTSGSVLFSNGTTIAQDNAQFFWDDTNNRLGIGIATPEAKLEVVGSSSSGLQEVLRLRGTGAGGAVQGGPYISLRPVNTDPLLKNWELARVAASSVAFSYASNLLFYTNTGGAYTDITEKMRISSAGNVGIGTTAPYSRFTTYGALSTSTSQISIVNSEGGHAIIRSGIAGENNNGISLITASVDGSSQVTRMVINPSGNVGIGTTAPVVKLAVAGTTTDTLRIGQTENLTGNKYMVLGMNIASQYAQIEATRYGEAYLPVVINPSGGNVGIGTTAPVARLHVAAQGALSTDIAMRVRNSANTADLFNVNGNGNVGIGITTPADKLEVSGSGNVAIRVRTSTNTGSDYAALRYVQDATEVAVTYTNLGNYITSLGGTERMRILANGNVGIGTSSPTFTLDVTGSAGATARFRGAGQSTISLNDGTNENYLVGISGAIRLVPSGSIALTALGNGNVGIGTTNPAYKLDIVGFANSTSGFRVTDGTIDNRISWSSGNVGFFGTVSNHPIAFNTNLSERMRITSTGNVGIGTTTTGSKLHVLLNGNASGGPTGNVASFQNSSSGSNAYISLFGSFSAETGIIFTDESEQYKGKIGYNNNSEHMYFQTDGSERMRITSTGNVGIGNTAPGYNLDVTGSIRATQYVYANDSFVGNNLISISNNDLLINKTTAYSILLYTSGTEKMRINAAGNVGIGTTAPVGRLDVRAPGALSIDTAFRVRNSADSNNLMIINGAGGIGVGTTSPLPSAVLDINSTTQGFLPPRMTNAQRTAISLPAVGLMVYCTDATEGLYIYKSTGWTFII